MQPLATVGRLMHASTRRHDWCAASLAPAITATACPVTATTTHDLFLSYNSADCDAVLAVRGLLEARGVKSFLDRVDLIAGQPWPQALEEVLSRVQAVSIFIGPH